MLALLAAGCGQRGGESGSAAAADREPVEVRTAVSTERQQPITLTLDGTLLADEDSNVTSIVPGRVMEVRVERGAHVAEGDPLVVLRDVDYRLQASAARAQLEQARARLGIDENAAPPAPADTPEVRAAQNNAELAEATLRRSEELAQRGALSAQQLDEVRSRAASAREQHQSALNAARGAIASLASARVALSQASSALTETTVRAPFAGEIADRMVSVGEYVSPQTPLVTLVRTDPLRLELQVPQQSLRVVRVGQSVDVRVDALPDQRFTATIRYVSAAVRRDTRGLVVEAVIENGQGLLRPGMFATARIDTGQTRRTAVVPASAVLVEAGVNRAFVVHDGVIVERVVTVADRSEGQVVIEEGVTPGESVAIERVGELADGMRVVAPSPAAEPVAPATGS